MRYWLLWYDGGAAHGWVKNVISHYGINGAHGMLAVWNDDNPCKHHYMMVEVGTDLKTIPAPKISGNK